MKRVLDADAAIAARPGELQAERAGHRRFRAAGIGRAVMRRVAPHRRQAPPARPPGRQRRGQRDEERREPRGRQVDEVVEAGRGPAEGRVPRACGDRSSVGGVDRLVEGAARQSRERRARRPARRRRPRNSPPGSRSRRGRRPASSRLSGSRPTISRPRRGRRRRLRFSRATATRVDVLVRLRCASRRRGGERDGHEAGHRRSARRRGRAHRDGGGRDEEKPQPPRRRAAAAPPRQLFAIEAPSSTGR